MPGTNYQNFWNHEWRITKWKALRHSAMTLGITGHSALQCSLLSWLSFAECNVLFSVILSVIMLNVVMLSVAFYLLLCWVTLCWMLHFIYNYAECLYAQCRVLFTVMLSVFLLNIVMLNVVASNENSIASDFLKRIKVAIQQVDQLDNSMTSTQVKIIGEGFQLEIKRGWQLILNWGYVRFVSYWENNVALKLWSINIWP